MTLFGLLILVIIVCLIVYLVQAWNPPAPWRTIIFAVLVLFLVLFLLKGVLPQGSGPWKL